MNTCDAIEAFFAYGPQFCGQDAVTYITTTDEFGQREYFYLCDEHYEALLGEEI